MGKIIVAISIIAVVTFTTFFLLRTHQVMTAVSVVPVYEKPYLPGYGSRLETQTNIVLFNLEPGTQSKVLREEFEKDFKYYEIEYKNNEGKLLSGYVIYGMGSFNISNQ